MHSMASFDEGCRPAADSIPLLVGKRQEAAKGVMPWGKHGSGGNKSLWDKEGKFQNVKHAS